MLDMAECLCTMRLKKPLRSTRLFVLVPEGCHLVRWCAPCACKRWLNLELNAGVANEGTDAAVATAEWKSLGTWSSFAAYPTSFATSSAAFDKSESDVDVLKMCEQGMLWRSCRLADRGLV